jgi:hypothetical protein
MSSLIYSSGLTAFALPRGKIAAAVASNALTVSIKTAAGNDPSPTDPIHVAMQMVSGSGAVYEGRTVIAPLSATLSSGSTTGFAAAVAARLWVLLFDDAGTLRLGLRNCVDPLAAYIYPLSEFGVGSTTADGGAGGADSAGVTYSDVAVISKPFRILGFVDLTSGLATPGTWDVGPDVIQMLGPGIHRPGEMIQTSPNYLATISSTTATIPYDDTIPQKTEGDQFFSTSIAAPAAANIIQHDALINFSGTTGADRLIAALFRGTASDGLSVCWQNVVFRNSARHGGRRRDHHERHG